MNKIDALHSHLAPPSGTDDASPMLQPGDASAQLLPRHRYPYVTASRRSPVMSLNGAVACSQPLAAAAGYDILKMGGNAADAAVAVAAALNVTEPTSTGIGGDLFVLYFDAKTKQVKSLNGSGRAPKNLKLEDMQAKGYYQIPASDVNSATVPGAAAGWLDTLEMFGSHKVTPLQVLQPAIDLAENGYPVHPISAVMWQSAWDKLKGGKDDWLLDGKAPMAGQVISIPNLAKTFRLLATKGKDGFYKGEVAQAIVDVVKEFGGVMSLEDLASHTSTPNEPIFLDYKGIRVYEHGPNGQGIVALIALGILEQLEKSGKIPSPAEIPLNSAAYLHLLIEVLRFAFADAMQYVADPEFSKVPVKGLLSPEYLAERAKMFNPVKAAENVKYGELAAYGGDTVYFSVVDKDGNACSFINSVFHSFGSGAVARGTGVILQNRGSGFVIDPAHPNRLEGGKRPFHTILPVMATHADTGDLFLCFGNMGGWMQPQGHVQNLLNIIRGMDPQSSVDTLRFCILIEQDGTVNCEEGLDEKELAKLSAMGHRIAVIRGHDRGVFGRAQIIERRVDARTGKVVFMAGSDPRGDGHAVAW